MTGSYVHVPLYRSNTQIVPRRQKRAVTYLSFVFPLTLDFFEMLQRPEFHNILGHPRLAHTVLQAHAVARTQ